MPLGHAGWGSAQRQWQPFLQPCPKATLLSFSQYISGTSLSLTRISPKFLKKDCNAILDWLVLREHQYVQVGLGQRVSGRHQGGAIMEFTKPV